MAASTTAPLSDQDRQRELGFVVVEWLYELSRKPNAGEAEEGLEVALQCLSQVKFF